MMMYDKILLADTDLFFFYLKGGKLAQQAKHVIKMASRGALELRTAPEVYDDAISALRSDNVAMPTIIEFVSMMKSIPHRALALNAEVAEEALTLYRKYGGRRKLSYFDSFHAATAKRYDLKLLTSDGYMQDHASKIGIEVRSLQSIITREGLQPDG